MRQRVVSVLRELDAISVENPAYPGTPDVNHSLGLLELKREKSWPVNGGPLRVPHFTPQQRVFLERRHRKGGLAQLLIQVGSDWLLLDGDVAARLLGHATREELMAAACWKSKGLDSSIVKAIQDAFERVSGYTSSNVDPA